MDVIAQGQAARALRELVSIASDLIDAGSWRDDMNDTQKTRFRTAMEAAGFDALLEERGVKRPLIAFATGDSIPFANSDNNQGLWGGNSFPQVMSWLSGGRIVFRGQSAIPGNTSAQVATRFVDESLTYPGVNMMLIMAGTNDVTAGVAQATTIANIVSMVRASRQRGQQVTVLSPPPRGDNAGYNTTTNALIAALQPAVEDEGAIFVDINTPLAASGYAAGSANTDDGVHPKAPAVKTIAQTALDHLDSLGLLPSIGARSMVPDDQFGVPNASYTSTFTQSGYGTVPTSYILSGASATATVAVDPTSGARLLSIAATTGTVQFASSSSFSLAGFAGKTVAFSGRLKTSGLAATGSKVRIRLQGNSAATKFNLWLLYDLSIDGDGYFYGETFIPASAAAATGSIGVDIIASGACTVSFGEMALRTLSDVPLGLFGTRSRRIPRPGREVSANTTLTVDDNILYVDASAGAITITLPVAGKSLYGAGSYISAYQKGMYTQGLDFTIVKTDATANPVTVQRVGADTINGTTSVSTTTQYGRLNPICRALGLWVA